MPASASRTSRRRSGPGRRFALKRQLTLLLYGAAVVVYTLDRVTKLLAERHLEGRPPIDVIPGVLQFRFTTNPGGAFGLFGRATWLFVGASLVVVVIIVVASRRPPSQASAVALGLVLGGALGNLTDRLVRGPELSGEVVDFIDFQVWPIFNIADSCIVIGAALLLLTGARVSRTESESTE
jgi:signal peptidase II